MAYIKQLFAASISVVTLSACVQTPNVDPVTPTHNGSLSCFNKNNKKDISKKKFTCELSSAARFGEYIVTDNDKDKTSVLFYKINGLKKYAYQRNVPPTLKIKFPKEYEVQKIESTSIFKNWVISFGSYDRDIDSLYTKIVAFKFDEKKKKATEFQLLAGPELYTIFKKVLNRETPTPIDYFKFEASAIVPHPTNPEQHILLLGVREDGKSYKEGENKASTKILSVTIFEKNGKIILGNDWKLVYNNIYNRNFGFSSFEYNPDDKHLYALLAYEKGESFSGKLMRISIPDLLSNKSLQLVNETIFNNHKPEGLAYLGNGDYFIVADDDRGATPLPGGTREVSEAAYMIVNQKHKE